MHKEEVLVHASTPMNRILAQELHHEAARKGTNHLEDTIDDHGILNEISNLASQLAYQAYFIQLF